MDRDAALSSAVQAQVALLQAAGHLGDLGQGEGDGLFQICRQEEDAHDNDGNAHQGGADDCHNDLTVCLCGGNAGKEEPADRPGGVSDGDIGAQVLLVQNGCRTHIALPLLQHDLGQLGGQRRTHHPLSVLDHGSVGPRIPLKDGKLTAHTAFQLIQQLIDILCAVRLTENIAQHIGAIGTTLFQHPH